MADGGLTSRRTPGGDLTELLAAGKFAAASRAAGLVARCLPVLVALGACTEEAIVAVDPDLPGATAPTLELSRAASELVGWRDTTYLGYDVPATASFKTLADRADLTSRVLSRFNVPDSLVTSSGDAEIDEFIEASVRVVFDLEESTFALPYTLEVFALGMTYDSLEATWIEARDGVPWMTPGGDLTELLAAGEFAAAQDTVEVGFVVPADPVLQAWRATEGEPGVALVVTAAGSNLVVRSLNLRARLTVVGQTDTLPATFRPRAATFIYDPPQPAADVGLRLAGLPSARFYLEFPVPDVLDGIPLADVTINHAELRFQPLAPPPQPFAMEKDVITSPVEVAADPFEAGPKVPVGGPVLDPATNRAQFITVTPGGLAEGQPLRINVTELVDRVASVDTLDLVRIAVRPSPLDGQAFGFWEFGSVESPFALQPELLLLVTLRPGFEAP